MDQIRKEEVMQAVLIADNFNDNLMPMTLTTSAALIPLVNVPMIDYALEALNRSGVEEVFVFASTFMEQIKQHIKNGRAKKHSWSIGMLVHVVGSEGCRCLGDALRDLDAKGLIRGHFILMGCDTVCSAQLGPILAEHKRRCTLDKGAAMTIVLKQTSRGQRTGNEVLVAIDADSQRLLYHQRIGGTKERAFRAPHELFLLNSSVQMRHDMLDAQIAICAPAALPLFADNFDFATRDDFIRGLLINEEILASTMYFAELPAEQYAAKVTDWQAYQAVAKDVINRWAYPLVPDMGVCRNRQMYMFLRNNVYRAADVQLARTGVLREDVVVRAGSVVGEGAQLARAVLGAGCQVAAGCRLEGAFLWDDVQVAEECELRHCVLGKGVRLGRRVRVADGAVLGDGVELGEGSVVERHFVQATRPVDEFTGKPSEDCIQLGPKAFVIPDPEADEDAGSDDDDEEAIVAPGIVRMSRLAHNYESSEYCSSSEDDDSRSASPVQEDENIFLSEVIDSLNRGFADKSNPEFLILEINSSRYAYNMSLTEVNYLVVKACLSLQPIVQAPADANLVAIFKQIITYLGPMFRNYIRGADAQRDCLLALSDSCGAAERLRGRIAQLVHYLYEQDILGEEAILKWYGGLAEAAAEETRWVREALAKLVAWLEAESSEGEGEEEEESSEEED